MLTLISFSLAFFAALREAILNKLVFLQYQRNDVELTRGDFRARGEIIEIMLN